MAPAGNAACAPIADLACRLESRKRGLPAAARISSPPRLAGFAISAFATPKSTWRRWSSIPDFMAELERRIILCYTGASRFSGDTITRVMRAYERGDGAVTGALRAIRDVAERMAEALVAGDLVRVGALLSENWRRQQELDPAMCTPEMTRLESGMRSSGALGGKASGSGAGGCMFFLGPDDPRPAVAAAHTLGMRILPVRWSARGLHAC